MDFKYQGTTKALRQQLRGHLSRSAHGLREPSEPQSIAWGLLNDFEQAVQMLHRCQGLAGTEKGIGAEIHAFLSTRG